MEKEELFIGKVKALTTVTEVKEFFDTYIPEESIEKNVALLKSAKIKADTLKLASELLSSMNADFPQPAKEISASKATTKEAIARDIVRFIHRCREMTCLKCSTDYVPFSSTNTGSVVTCHFCHTPSHLGCYADSELDPEAGVVFVCPPCLGSQIPPIHVAPPPEPEQTAAPNSPAADQLSSQSSTEAVREPVVERHKSKKTLLYDRSKAVCPLLLEGNCPHGISGKGCANYHPPWCFKFQNNGRGGERGCHIADDRCTYFHPQLCQNAVKQGICLNKPCKRVHIRGTITNEKNLKYAKRGRQTSSSSSSSSSSQQNRHPPKSNENRERSQTRDNSGYSSGRKRTESNSSTPSNTTGANRNRTVSFNETHVSEPSQDFRNHYSSMKADLTKDIAAMIQSSLRDLLRSPQVLQNLQHQDLLYPPQPSLNHHLSSQQRQYQPTPPVPDYLRSGRHSRL